MKQVYKDWALEKLRNAPKAKNGTIWSVNAVDHKNF